MSSLVTSPLEQFAVQGIGLGLINYSIALSAMILAIVSFHSLAWAPTLVPTRWSLAVELSVSTLQAIAQGSLGTLHLGLLPLVYALFWVIMTANLLGNVPYSYAMTTSLCADLGLSFGIWMTCLLTSLSVHGVRFAAFFAPSGTPLALLPMLGLIELISFVARAVSLGVREFANMVAGHALLAILSGFLAPMLSSAYLPLGLVFLPLVGALMVLELAVAVIQAYVMTVLASSYLRDALELH